MLYFVCTRCDDKFVMDEDFVEVPAENVEQDNKPLRTTPATRRVGLDYRGHDCLCPICEQFAGRLVGPSAEPD